LLFAFDPERSNEGSRLSCVFSRARREHEKKNQRPHIIGLQKPPRSGQVSSVTAWDVKIARRALVLSIVAFACALLVTAATDEGNVSWLERIARTLPVLPIAGGLGAWLTMAPLRTRGDVIALEALGRNPWEMARPAIAASVLLHALACALLAILPVHGFFPRPAPVSSIVFKDGDFVDGTKGVRIHADGTLEPADIVSSSHEQTPGGARFAVGAMLLFAGAALPMWALVVRREQAAKAALAGAVTGGATVLCFHASAQGQLPAIAAAVPSGALLAFALMRYRSLSWQQ
jgi:hypothetical protein